MAAMLQTRPGNWVTWILIAASLLSIFGGIAGSIAFALLWFVTRGAVSSAAARPTGNCGLPEDEPDLNGDLSDDDDPASPKGIQGRRCWAESSCTNLRWRSEVPITMVCHSLQRLYLTSKMLPLAKKTSPGVKLAESQAQRTMSHHLSGRMHRNPIALEAIHSHMLGPKSCHKVLHDAPLA